MALSAIMESPPLILTLALDSATQQYFDALRTRYFPPERNFMAAHCTLFHHLPGSEEKAVRSEIEAVAARTPELSLEVLPPRSLGRGVAFPLQSEALLALHKRLQEVWRDWLTPQDRQRLWPHITVQNKVDGATARATLAVLQSEMDTIPKTALGTGLRLWYYRGGPWEEIAQFSFGKDPVRASE